MYRHCKPVSVLQVNKKSYGLKNIGMDWKGDKIRDGECRKLIDGVVSEEL